MSDQLNLNTYQYLIVGFKIAPLLQELFCLASIDCLFVSFFFAIKIEFLIELLLQFLC